MQVGLLIIALMRSEHSMECF